MVPGKCAFPVQLHSVRPLPLPEGLRFQFPCGRWSECCTVCRPPPDPSTDALPGAALLASCHLWLRCRAADSTPTACAFSILQPLGRQVSTSSSRYLLLNGLACPTRFAKPFDSASGGSFADRTSGSRHWCCRLPRSTFFIVRSVLAPWPVFPDRSDDCSTQVLRLSAALKRLVLPALQPATIHHSGILWNRTLPQMPHLRPSPGCIATVRPHPVNAH
jgi:hypothetical protein